MMNLELHRQITLSFNIIILLTMSAILGMSEIMYVYVLKAIMIISVSPKLTKNAILT